jgi:deoxycytidylate deaminase
MKKEVKKMGKLLMKTKIKREKNKLYYCEMPDTYISRNGIDEVKIKEIVFNDDLNVLKKQNSELQTQSKLAIEKFAMLESREKEYDEMFAILKKQIAELKAQS